MVKIHTTITLDPKIRKKGVDILKEKGIKLSFFIEQSLRTLIKNHKKEVNNNATFKAKEG